jgi:hypothetical protein
MPKVPRKHEVRTTWLVNRRLEGFRSARNYDAESTSPTD